MGAIYIGGKAFLNPDNLVVTVWNDNYNRIIAKFKPTKIKINKQINDTTNELHKMQKEYLRIITGHNVNNKDNWVKAKQLRTKIKILKAKQK
jgi:hypothetical protein